MEEFLNQIIERVALYRASLEEWGFSDDELTQKTTERFNAVVMDYYAKLMELMSEDDYQVYKSAIDQKDESALQGVLGKYGDDIAMLQMQLVESL